MIESEQIVNTVRLLEKFRKTIVVLLCIIIAAAGSVYFMADFIISVIAKPLNGLQLFFMTPAEGVMTKIEISFFGGLILAFPIVVYILVSLARKRLSKRKRRFLFFLIIPFATMAFYGGMAFAYKLVLPTTVKFLLDSASDVMKPLLSGRSYFSFVIFFLLAVGLIFELPLMLVALSRLGIITFKALQGKRKVAVMATVILMALLTPTPDAFTLLAVSLPMILLYEISTWWIFILEKLDKRKGVQ